MSARSAPTPTPLARPMPVVATVLLALDALRSFAAIGGFLSGASIPAAIVAFEVALGVVEVIAAVGLWRRRSWSTLLATAAAALSVLISVVGVVSAGSAAGKAIAALGVILGIAILVVVRLPTARRSSV